MCTLSKGNCKSKAISLAGQVGGLFKEQKGGSVTEVWPTKGRDPRHEAGEEGRGQISCRALCIMVRNLDFILNRVRNHWQVLSIRIVWYFINFFLTVLWKIDCRGAKGKQRSLWRPLWWPGEQ